MGSFTICADGPGGPSTSPERWSARGYLWHVFDIQRHGTERLRVIIEHPAPWKLSTEACIRRNAHEVVHHARDTMVDLATRQDQP